jgi:predicted Fe-Mo cluster-binding NifX family protein
MTTTVTRISSEAKTALRNYFIDLIVATMAQPTSTTAATASSTALATTTTTLATTTTVTRISSEAKTALRNYFIDLIVATMAQPTSTTAATTSSTALATMTTTLATTTTVTRISSESKTALRNYFIDCKWPLNKKLPRGRELVDILGGV